MLNIQLLISPEISAADAATLARASSDDERVRIRQQLSDRILSEALELARDPSNVPRRELVLLWLLASERLEVRFAFPRHVENAQLFHEKIGIFDFADGERVAFTGSANETSSGHLRNYESLDAFRSWVPADLERVKTKASQFEEAWDGRALGLLVLRPSLELLAEIRNRAASGQDFPGMRAKDVEPEYERLWKHQEQAIQAFAGHRRGILEMATGTGKTRVALRILRQLFRDSQIDTAIVAADGTDLLDQWHRQVLALTQELGRPVGVLRHYGPNHDMELFTLMPRGKILVTSRPALRHALACQGLLPQRTILIHDEVHRLGSPDNQTKLSGLSDNIQFRLGLSATPEREYDRAGTAFIENNVGPVIYQFDLAAAIRTGVLCPFNYIPLNYEPDQDDRDRIQDVYKSKAARAHAGNPMTNEEVWIALARVHKTSNAKLPHFSALLQQRPELLRRCLIFVETREYGDRVLDLIHRYRADFHTYYSEEDASTLQRFAAGELECLLTCHRLSEGIDIRSVENIVLFSSARSRLETVQRIGRCLRVDPSNPGKRATVVDFLRSTEAKEAESPDTARRQWLLDLSALEAESHE